MFVCKHTNKKIFIGNMEKNSVKTKKNGLGRPRRIKEDNILSKRSRADKVIFAIVTVIFIAYALSMVFAVGWMLMTSLKSANEDLGFGLPQKLLFSNYTKAFTVLSSGRTTFFGMFFNSLWYTLIATALGVIMPCITGYVMSKYDFPGKNIIFTVAITSLTIPVVGNLASSLKLYGELQLLDTPLFVVVSSLGGFGGNFLIYYGFFKSVSWTYAEAAQIDGAGPFTVFFRIMLPQAIPIMMTYAIINAIFNWNDYQTVILYLQSYPTLSSGLYEYQIISERIPDTPSFFAGLIISMIPTIALFATFSNRVMTSLSVGGIKG